MTTFVPLGTFASLPINGKIRTCNWHISIYFCYNWIAIMMFNISICYISHRIQISSWLYPFHQGRSNEILNLSPERILQIFLTQKCLVHLLIRTYRCNDFQHFPLDIEIGGQLLFHCLHFSFQKSDKLQIWILFIA